MTTLEEVKKLVQQTHAAARKKDLEMMEGLQKQVTVDSGRRQEFQGYSRNPSESRIPKGRPLRDEALLCADAKRPLRDEASPPIYISLIGRRRRASHALNCAPKLLLEFPQT